MNCGPAARWGAVENAIGANHCQDSRSLILECPLVSNLVGCGRWNEPVGNGQSQLQSVDQSTTRPQRSRSDLSHPTFEPTDSQSNRPKPTVRVCVCLVLRARRFGCQPRKLRLLRGRLVMQMLCVCVFAGVFAEPPRAMPRLLQMLCVCVFAECRLRFRGRRRFRRFRVAFSGEMMRVSDCCPTLKRDRTFNRTEELPKRPTFRSRIAARIV